MKSKRETTTIRLNVAKRSVTGCRRIIHFFYLCYSSRGARHAYASVHVTDNGVVIRMRNKNLLPTMHTHTHSSLVVGRIFVLLEFLVKYWFILHLFCFFFCIYVTHMLLCRASQYVVCIIWEYMTGSECSPGSIWDGVVLLLFCIVFFYVLFASIRAEQKSIRFLVCVTCKIITSICVFFFHTPSKRRKNLNTQTWQKKRIKIYKTPHISLFILYIKYYPPISAEIVHSARTTAYTHI